jgi:imidazolonepropionase-like amidohydrolase
MRAAKSMSLLLLVFVVLTATLARAQSTAPQGSPTATEPHMTAIKAGHLIDVDAAKVLDNQIILIRDNRVAAVGPNLTIPAGAEVIDLSTMTVLPGLIDCHTHLSDGARDPSGDPLSYLKRTGAEVAFESVPNARVTLLSGFTTVAMRDAIARGDIIGPRMFVVGAYVTITGGAGALTGASPDIQLPWDMHYGQADSPWEVRAVIRKLANQHVDAIKILSSGAVLEHGSNPNSQEFTLEELQAAVDEANHFGLRVAAHAHSNQGIKNAIRAGVASVEHAENMDDESIALAKQHGTYLDMDLYDEQCIEDEARRGAIPMDFVTSNAGLAAKQQESFRKAVQAGVKMSFGTDSGVCPYGQSGLQFAYMVKYGMTPMQAIQSATSSAADLLGQSAVLGSIRAGKFADLVAVPGDPLQNIRLLENVSFVMKDAKVYKVNGVAKEF